MDQTTATGVDDPAHADAPLPPGPGASDPLRAAPDTPGHTRQPATAWVAAQLVDAAKTAGKDGLIYLASSERRADEIGRALRQFAPETEVLVLPPWDCLPYDRASASRHSMGRRMAVLARLCDPIDGQRVLVASVEALLQRIPPADVIRNAFLRLKPGDAIDRSELEAFARATGYVADDRIDEPGEIALLGEVIDVFPPASESPVRLSIGADGKIAEIRCYDPLTQRTADSIREVVLGPASELILPPDVERSLGHEHRAPAVYPEMDLVFSRMPKAIVARDLRADQRADDFIAQVEEAHEARASMTELEGERPLPPDRLYLTRKEWAAALAKRTTVELDSEGVEAIPNFAVARNPGRAFSDFVQGQLDAGATVLLAGLAHELRPLVRALKRGLDRQPELLGAWSDAAKAKAGSLVSLEADLEAGFTSAAAKLAVVTASDVLGGRLAARGAGGGANLLTDPELRIGDVVIHEDHGLGVLRALEQVTVDGAPRDAVRLEYYGGADLLVPVEEFGRLWRYGAQPDAVTLDRLHTDAWIKRRVELSRDIDSTAEQLVALAQARSETEGRVLEPPKAAFARFAARFPYPDTPDQAAAIEAVVKDLASGKVMNRLVCGDVGFGKTEVALRAAAAAALAGAQVAVVAPTTVLARQHFESFRRRFAGTGLEVGLLSRLVDTAEAKRVKAGLSDGSIRVVIGTHALAGKDVAFADLGLLVIDEEQRFGAKLKEQLKGLGERVHLLTLTATPIPRTLQLAMVGVQDVSVIATPPARRRPIRTFLAPFDAATVRTTLMRERRRGGQSFFVTPRIEDIEPMTEQLRTLAPELKIHVAHGQLPPEEVDEVMVAFADGDGDVLLATNIIESGLDVPRANTMLIWRADRFGLAQLHQLRGRVGRGRQQGIAYMLTDPAEDVAEATRARLSTLEAFDRLGSGLAISAQDLELRGAGDLVGEEQAGHVRLIGTALYQRLLSRAVRVAKGELTGPDWTPEIAVGASGALTEAYVPDPIIRINLYARLARLTDAEEVEAFAAEVEDRFGAPPAETVTLLDLARLRALARQAGARKLVSGPKGAAITLERQPPVLASAPDGEWKEGRLVLPSPDENGWPLEGLLEVMRELAGTSA